MADELSSPGFDPSPAGRVRRLETLVRSHQGNTAALEGDVATLQAMLGGTQVIGPFDAGVGATVGQYAEATLNVVHNLGLVGAQTIVGQLYDGNFAAGFSWRPANVAANSFQITLMNLRNGNGAAGWKGYVLIV